jgi:pterin-4a-carbinolamine dehydratase
MVTPVEGPDLAAAVEVRFTVWSHSLDAITSNDVVLAGKINDVVSKTV